MRWRAPWGALALVIGLVTAVLAFPAHSAHAASGNTWYVDCSAPSGGDGSAANPFNSLEAANGLVLGPGDQLLFRRGTACSGMLAPQGSGAPGNPIVIADYGDSAAPPPRIDGQAAVAAVWLSDMSYVTVQDLELTNAGDSTGVHRGMYFTSNAVPVTGITIRNLVVDDVDSTNSFTGGKQGGGIVGQTLSATGRFSNVLIEDNDVHDVSRQGITLYGTTSSTRPPATSPWPAASTGVVIQDNIVERVQGDGIVPLGTDGAVVQHNFVSQGNLGGYNFASPNANCAAGIWTWDANNTLIQYNEVSDMQYGPSTTPGALNGCDGEGFDADYNQDGTIIQYNYSHDNQGGFLLLCTDQSPHRVDVRYNLSVNDIATLSPAPCAGVFDAATNNLDGVRIYNNTIVAATPRVVTELDESLAQDLSSLYVGFLFENNIVYATSPDAANHYFNCGSVCSNNLFYGMPAPSNAVNTLTSNPLFLPPALNGNGPPGPSAFRLRGNSPAIGAGVAIPAGFPEPPAVDYFGKPIENPPTIGFSQRASG